MWLVYAILAAVLWGLNYTLIEKIVETISPITLLAFEMLVGAIVFLIIGYFTDLKADLAVLASRPTLLGITIVEVITLLLASFFIVISIRVKNATVAGILELIYPLFTIFFTWIIFGKHHINTPVIAGGILILAGVAVMSFA